METKQPMHKLSTTIRGQWNDGSFH